MLARSPSSGTFAFTRRLKASASAARASDHGVSEALYLRDPDGNGVELYWDRDAADWPRTTQGALAMGTSRLDLESLLSEPEPIQPQA